MYDTEIGHTAKRIWYDHRKWNFLCNTRLLLTEQETHTQRERERDELLSVTTKTFPK
jgi:hypothetical protein